MSITLSGTEKQTRRELKKIRELMENGQTELVKAAVKKHNSSMSSLRNWLKDEKKAFASHDVRKGVLTSIANSVPEFHNITRKTVYDFILEESGGSLEAQHSLKRLYGNYKVVHNLEEFEFRDLVINYHKHSHYPYFFFIMSAPGPANSQVTRKSDGFVFSTGSMLILSGLEKKIDCMIYLGEPFDVNDVIYGMITIYLKDTKRIITSKIALLKMKDGVNKLVRKLKEAEVYVTSDKPLEIRG